MPESQPDKPATDTSTPADPFDDAVTAMSDSVREWVDAAKSSYDKALSGSYTTRDLAGDVAAMTARVARDWARMLTTAAQVASSLATTPVPPANSKAAEDG
jgi:hypothetical protein